MCFLPSGRARQLIMMRCCFTFVCMYVGVYVCMCVYVCACLCVCPYQSTRPTLVTQLPLSFNSTKNNRELLLPLSTLRLLSVALSPCTLHWTFIAVFCQCNERSTAEVIIPVCLMSFKPRNPNPFHCSLGGGGREHKQYAPLVIRTTLPQLVLLALISTGK